MDADVMAWCKSVVEQLGIAATSTLECGALDHNGVVRPLFSGPYCGIDLQAGPNVDRVMDAERITFPDRSFDTVISTEMLEHCLRPWRAVSEMARVCAKGGYVILTCRSFDEHSAFPAHQWPRDYWRPTVASVWVMMEDAGLEIGECRKAPEMPGVYAWGRKP